jgi:ABC-2 type transport system ATP-binding protein
VLHQGKVCWTGQARELTSDRTLEAAFLELTGSAS